MASSRGSSKALNLEVLFDDLFHLGLDGGKVVFGQPLVAQIDVVVEAVIGRGAVREVGLWIEAFDGLRHDMRGGMTDDVGGFLGRNLGHGAVVIQGLHRNVSLERCEYAW